MKVFILYCIPPCTPLPCFLGEGRLRLNNKNEGVHFVLYSPCTPLPCFLGEGRLRLNNKNEGVHFVLYSPCTTFAVTMTQRSCLLLFLAVLVVSTCVYIVTQSIWMSAGIMIIIMLIDAALAQYDRKRQREKAEKELHEKENND